MFKSVAGFIVGGLIAGTVALLYAPQSGEETRREIKENVLEARQKASLALDEAKGRVAATVSDVTGKTQQMLDSLSQEAQLKTGRLKEIGGKMIDDQSASLEQAIDETKEVFSS